MISLPHLIGSTCLMAINHVKLLSIDFRPLMSKRHQSRIKLLHNALDCTVTGCLPPLCFRHLDDFPMDGGNGSPRPLQCEALNALLHLGRHGTSLVFIFSRRSGQSHQTICSVALDPPSQGSDQHLVFSRNLCQRNAIFQKGANHMKVRECLRPLSVCELGQGDVLLSHLLSSQTSAWL